MKSFIDLAKDVFQIEASAVLVLKDKLDCDYIKSIDEIIATKGKVIISGMGKSGIIGKKIAATLASTGTPSFFMHPGEAYHGDLGMVTSDDIFIAISNSGETEEVVKLIPFLKDNNNFIIAMTGNPKSTLALAANTHLDVGVEEEACPLQLAPTASTTATLAMGDALAVTLMKARDFRPEHFARFHPGGSLGRRLLSRVENEMFTKNLPFISSSSLLLDVIGVMTTSGLGIAIVNDIENYGIVTDGDIRRLIKTHQSEVFKMNVSEFVTKNPLSVNVGTRVEDALILMENKGVGVLLIKKNDEVVGVFKK
ncbi:KpsF/GutQ family sugar-phosphate isomerase [Amphritea sp. 2_MG-2023]|uniref:KpsF/GutQ family sugar-phosphate isomerase n=1 Tax=Amphritea TaxID=515417 RepID=UPI001C077559|nr:MULTISPECIES: KpsF/GutQ family sugar-phosphate isomerase [Amphritea]MBU2964995.1 KpsF/GutQ family sugar-phosphate isomerase [Amphritea atlantica]MDO6418780.1 KpsF/GutQ family sugar-phosphate isomerase [Amphritea sp. 2_MG-2023]